MPAAFTSWVLVSISLRTSVSNCAELSGIGSAPRPELVAGRGILQRLGDLGMKLGADVRGRLCRREHTAQRVPWLG